MKNTGLILLFALSLIATSEMYGQLGVRAGINFANVSHDNKQINIKTNPGYHLGLFYDIPFASIFALRPAVLYTIKGSKIENNSNIKNVLKSGYLEIPVDLHLRFGGEDGRFSVYGGPYWAALLNADQDGTDVKDQYSGSDYGFNLGATFQFNPIGIGLNYGAGISDIADNSTGDVTIKNRSLSAYLTFRF